MFKRPELLAPAGDREKLQFAIHYGADAVYLGLKDYSLRGNIKGFDEQTLTEAIEFCRKNNKKVYVTVNIFAHNKDLKGIERHFEFLNSVKPDGVILSDLGVLNIKKRIARDIPVHISTQANITNYESALFYQDLDVKRLILSRELSLKEIEKIRKKVTIELEMFVHGAICISYSGRCYLSSFLTYRSGNKGLCTHPCRWSYTLMEEKRQGEYFPVFEDEKGSYIMNSKDLCLIEYLPDLIDMGIDSFKIEGRMKGINYLSGVTHVYRKAIDAYVNDKDYEKDLFLKELLSFSSRGFTTGMLLGKQKFYDYNFDDKSSKIKTQLVGIVQKKLSRTKAEVAIKANLKKGETIYFLTPGYEEIPFEVKSMEKEGNPVDLARNDWTVIMDVPPFVRELDISRKFIE